MPTFQNPGKSLLKEESFFACFFFIIITYMVRRVKLSGYLNNFPVSINLSFYIICSIYYMLSFCNSSYSLRSCSSKLLQVPGSKLKTYGDRRFSVAGPKLWNDLPVSVKNAKSLTLFKKKNI